VKVNFTDGWLHVRGSNTEPIIRLVVEAADEALARQILDSVFEKVARVLKLSG
jgi:phosphomannomutase